MKIIKDTFVTIIEFYTPLQKIFYSKNFKAKKKFVYYFTEKAKTKNNLSILY